MRFDLAHQHLSRRDALKMGAAGAAAAAVAAIGPGGPAGATGDAVASRGRGMPGGGGPYDDEMFDFEAVREGGYWVSPYGPGDQRGTLNEVTAERTAAALRGLDSGRPVNIYELGEEMFNGFPAFPSDPPRTHDMFLYVFGYSAAAAGHPDFAANGGIQSGDVPFGPNGVVGHEERFAENFTFQIASQIDGLGHVGIATGDERARRGWATRRWVRS